MNAPASNETNSVRPKSLLWACALLTTALSLLLPCFAAYGYFTSGVMGSVAAVVAFGICLSSGILALCVTAISQKMNQGMQGILAAMMVRMSVPLAALIVLPKVSGPLVAAGITGLLMAYYLVTLAIETWLSLRFVPASKSSGLKAPTAKVA